MLNQEKVDEVNKKVLERGYVDREHLMEFLTCIETNDAQSIIKEVKDWLTYLHKSPEYATVTFPKDDIDAIIGDLDSYGRVSPEHIMEFKQKSNKSLPVS